jgi:SAM-dependent methyltransferase
MVAQRAFPAAIKGRFLPTPIGYVGDRLFSLMRGDWGHVTETETRLARVETEVFGTLRECAPDFKTALVLGAGLGRVAADLGEIFDRVVAVDASLVAAVLYSKLLREDVVSYQINQKSAYTISDQARKVVSTMSRPIDRSAETRQRPPSRLMYGVADAHSLPLMKSSISAIVSIYFSDVIPLTSLLKQSRRLLKPGGVFLHFGPLQYHFDDIAQHWSAQEVPKLFNRFGFSMEVDRWVKDPRPWVGTMSGSLWNAWLFCARRSVRSGAP